MHHKREITIYDIASILQISPATVSRGLKNHPAISNKTKKKIQDKAKELGYRSNNFASNLRQQKTHTIGIIIHELNSHFITSVLAGIEAITAQTPYDLIIGHSSESYKKEVANAHNLFHKRVDGIIASLAYDTDDLSHFDPFFKKEIPVVFFDRVEKSTACTKVIIDNTKAGYTATRHLIEQGCKRIAHVTGNLKRNVYAHRLKGFQKAIKDAGLKYEESYIIINDLGEDESRRAAKKFLSMRIKPDAVFVTNDFCAAIMIQTFKEAGLRVPADIAVVGFNNDVISKIVEPALTTINYPGIKIGEVAAKSLIEQLNGGPNTQETIIIESELIVRASSLRKITTGYD